ncbi:aminotransferase class V [Kurthia sp. 3B1D]|uniref:Aminotransferase class V n=1 Tax=Candidatus Kurthia intestinigallinarum TaxID=1562256 RepID=A0A433RXX9_9BACL|nr:cysteine desulfurase family protein [Kurthia sp. 3B1D]RUS58134.1 aminotransferase class V [Kurthia sp. 3B1D]
MIYLDHSATTKPSADVMKAFVQANERYYANPASLHEMGVEVNILLNRSREQIAGLIHTEPEHVIFTSGGSESNNFLIKGIARANTHRGKHIIVSSIEHASVLETARALEKEGFHVDYVDVDKHGIVDLNNLKAKLTKDTVVVSIMHVNNEIGAIQPIEEIAKIVHEGSRAFYHVDAVQSFGKLPVYFNGELGPDAISVSGHKINGLKGTGIAALRKRTTIEAIIHGGGQEMGLRSGTVAVPQDVAIAKAARLAEQHRTENVQQYIKWRNAIHTFLDPMEDVYVLSSNEGAPHIVSCSIRGIKGEVIVNAMQRQGVIVSTSSACHSKDNQISHVVQAVGVPDGFARGVIRISFGQGLTDADIEKFKEAFSNVVKQVRGEIKTHEMA